VQQQQRPPRAGPRDMEARAVRLNRQVFHGVDFLGCAPQ
jgi:hypothetical protein